MKLGAFQKRLRDNTVDLALFVNLDGDHTGANFFYFSGYSGWGFLAIPSKGRPFLVVPRMEYERAKKASRVRIVVSNDNILETLKKNLKSPVKIGIDFTATSISALKKLRKRIGGKYVDISSWCAELRVTKTKDELADILRACRITDDIFSKTFFNFKKFRTESDVAAFMVNEATARGVSLAYKPIIASGKNSCEPHHETSTEKLRKGFCLIDFGVKYRGYCSDVTRMVYLGKPSENELSHYNLVLEAQTAAYRKAKVGVSCKELSETAASVLGKNKKDMIHSLGHGFGLDIHELPRVRLKSKDILEADTVFTIEPGVYFPGKYGIRIEDDVLLRVSGPVRLTKTGKNLLIIL